MSGQNQMLADTREKEADKTLRMSQRAMDNMGDVAASRARRPDPGGADDVPRIMICKNCRQEVDAAANNCPNCGEALY